MGYHFVISHPHLNQSSWLNHSIYVLVKSPCFLAKSHFLPCFMLDFPISHGKTLFFLVKCTLWLKPIFVGRIPQLSQEVLVLDLLATFDCLDAVSQQRFLRRRVQPVLKRLGPTGRFRLGRDLWRSKKSLEIGWDTVPPEMMMKWDFMVIHGDLNEFHQRKRLYLIPVEWSMG